MHRQSLSRGDLDFRFTCVFSKAETAIPSKHSFRDTLRRLGKSSTIQLLDGTVAKK
jgi:hypothetical protein